MAEQCFTLLFPSKEPRLNIPRSAKDSRNKNAVLQNLPSHFLSPDVRRSRNRFSLQPRTTNCIANEKRVA